MNLIQSMDPAEAHEQLQSPKKGRKELFSLDGRASTLLLQVCHRKQLFFFEVYLNKHNLCYIYPTDTPWNDKHIQNNFIS